MKEQAICNCKLLPSSNCHKFNKFNFSGKLAVRQLFPGAVPGLSDCQKKVERNISTVDEEFEMSVGFFF